MAYITLLKRDDFNSLYRYGRIYVNPLNSLYLANSIEDYKNDSSVLSELFKERDDFEVSFEYLLIVYALDTEDVKSLIRIENVLGIYALDEQSEKSLSVRLDSKVIINPPIWSNAMNAIKKARIEESCKRGIDNVWKIFNLEEADKRKCSDIVTTSFVKEFVHEVYNDEQPFGEKSIWVYLLRYQRHEMYPQNDLGYFLDTVHVFTNWHFKDSNQMKTEITDVYNKLTQIEGRKGYSDILSYMENSPEIASFIERAGMDGFYRVAPLYLKLLDPFREGGIDLCLNIGGIPFCQQIKNLKKYGFDFCLAAYLLGIILGYEKTSDALYDTLQLNIFKKEESEVPPFRESNPPAIEETPSENLKPVEAESFMKPIPTKKKATTKDKLTLDTIKNLTFSYPCYIYVKGDSKNKKQIANYEDLVRTIASQQDKEWKLSK